LIVHPETLPEKELMLLPGNQLVNGIPVLVFQMPIAGGRIIVSVSDAHLQDVIANASNSVDLGLVVGESMFTRNGDVSGWKAASWTGSLTASSQFL
jgi:hypothetical protein